MKRFVNIAKVAVLAFAFAGCGGGSGLGPQELQKQEKKLRDRLPIDWVHYNSGDYQGAIDFFAKTLEQAETFEGSEAILNEIKSEAQNGIAWAFFRQQDLESAWNSFQQATRLNRRNPDAWAGWAGVALASGRYNDTAQFAIQALETGGTYNSAFRIDESDRELGHDRIDNRHIRLMLAEAYFQLGRYSAIDRADPNNATAQVRLLKGAFTFHDPGQLLQEISKVSLELQQETTGGF